MENLKKLVRKQLKEMANVARLYKIGDLNKADTLISLYAPTNFNWIGNTITIIKDAGENGIKLADIIDKLSEEFNYNKTSQEMNPPLARLVDSGVLRSSK
jgi:hypothetical protein